MIDFFSDKASQQDPVISSDVVEEKPKQIEAYSYLQRALVITSIATLVLGLGMGLTVGLLGIQSVTVVGGSTVLAIAAKKLLLSVASLVTGTTLSTNLLWIRGILARWQHGHSDRNLCLEGGES